MIGVYIGVSVLLMLSGMGGEALLWPIGFAVVLMMACGGKLR